MCNRARDGNELLPCPQNIFLRLSKENPSFARTGSCLVYIIYHILEKDSETYARLHSRSTKSSSRNCEISLKNPTLRGSTAKSDADINFFVIESTTINDQRSSSTVSPRPGFSFFFENLAFH